MSDEKCDNCQKDGTCEEQQSWEEGGEPGIMRRLVAERGCALFQSKSGYETCNCVGCM